MSSFSSDLSSRDFQVNIGQYFGRGWEIFKEYAWAFVVFTLVIGIISAVCSALPYPLGVNVEQGGGGLLFSILSAVLFAGYYIVAFQIARNRPKAFGDFFKGFNKFLPIFLVSLVGGILTFIGFLLLIVPGIYLAVAYMFSQPLVIDKNLGFWEALETSRKVISKKWFAFFGLLIAIFFLNVAGAIVLGIGLLVTIPLSFCIIAAAYEDVVGLNSVADATL